jgi:hypothetical protein
MFREEKLAPALQGGLAKKSPTWTRRAFKPKPTAYEKNLKPIINRLFYCYLLYWCFDWLFLRKV